MKRSENNNKPASLNFGEKSIGSNGIDEYVCVGNKSNIPIPINGLTVMSGNSSIIDIPKWNMFVIVRENGIMSSSVSLPVVSSFNSGQVIIIKNKQSSPIELKTQNNNVFDDSSTVIHVDSVCQLISDGVNTIYRLG